MISSLLILCILAANLVMLLALGWQIWLFLLVLQWVVAGMLIYASGWKVEK